MLTEEERLEIDAEAAGYAFRRSAVTGALMIVQRRKGWVDDEALRDVAAALDISQDEVDGIATFHNLIFRRPVGRRVILVCSTISCMLTGLDHNLDHLENRLGVKLGGTTPDGLFTLLTVPCLGACDRAPAMMVGTELYTGLTPGRIDEILGSYGWGK